MADASNNAIRKIAAGGVTTLAGVKPGCNPADGAGAVARFCAPDAVAVNGAGVAYVADSVGQTIRKVTPAGLVTTFAGIRAGLGLHGRTGQCREVQPARK